MEEGQGAFGEALREARENGDWMELQTFEGERISDADLSELEFRQVRFLRCQFTGCTFYKASFYDCRFEDCRWAGCRLEGSYWRGTALTGCKGDGCDFRRSHWKSCALSHTILRYANFKNSVWERGTWTDCDLREAALAEIRMVKPVFQRVDFTGADFFRTVLKGLDLSACDIEGIALSEHCAELRGAKIDAAQASVVAKLLGIEVV